MKRKPGRDGRAAIVDHNTVEYEVREYRPGDEEAILATFNRVFRNGDSASPLRSLAEWEWVFRQNPGGWRIWLALARGDVVAQSAGIGYRAWVDGRECEFSQSVDSMVHPDHRSGLKNPGLFVRTVERYIEAYGARPDLFFFGWPNAQAWRLGKAFLGYELVRRQFLLVWNPVVGTGEIPAGVEQVESLDAEMGVLWSRCARAWGASIVRDEAFLTWRFCQRPGHAYELFLVRGEQGEPRGLAACRAANWPAPDVYVIVDWLVPDDEPAVGEALLAAARARACDGSHRAVVTLFPPWSPWFQRFESAGFDVFPTDFRLASRSHDPRFGVRWLRENWWYQLAESDFV